MADEPATPATPIVAIAPNGYHAVNGHQFAKGNKGGPGNPNFARVHAIREEIFAACAEGNIGQIFRVLIDKALAGDKYAAQVVLDRLLGKPDQAHKIVAAIGTNALTPEQLGDIVLAARSSAPEL